LRSATTSVGSGSVFVISSNVETVMNRRPAVTGLNFLTPTVS